MYQWSKVKMKLHKDVHLEFQKSVGITCINHSNQITYDLEVCGTTVPWTHLHTRLKGLLSFCCLAAFHVVLSILKVWIPALWLCPLPPVAFPLVDCSPPRFFHPEVRVEE